MSLAKPADPLGHALMDYYKTKKQAEILVRSDILEDDTLPVSYFFRTYEQFPKLERIALDECRGEILDVGAGAGAHSLVLQKREMSVTALDISPLAVEVCKKRGVKKVMEGDIFQFEEARYDTLLFLMNGLGLAGSLEGLEDLLSRARKILKKGGQILIDSTDIRYAYKRSKAPLPVEGEKYYGEVNYQMEYKGIRGKWFAWLFAGYEILELYCERVGFECEPVAKGKHHQYLARLTPSRKRRR